jgi:hypothetical protein
LRESATDRAGVRGRILLSRPCLPDDDRKDRSQWRKLSSGSDVSRPRAPTPLRVAEWRPVLTRLSVAGILCFAFHSGKCPRVRASIIFPLFATAAGWPLRTKCRQQLFRAFTNTGKIRHRASRICVFQRRISFRPSAGFGNGYRKLTCDTFFLCFLPSVDIHLLWRRYPRRSECGASIASHFRIHLSKAGLPCKFKTD